MLMRTTSTNKAVDLPKLGADLETLRAAARHCRACPLWQRGTQTVFGEGPERAQVMLVGEQPGDQEDLQGRPFVGPAGQLLNLALAEAGVDRQQVYVSNAVKHFKWVPRGKRRLHKKPSDREVAACFQWLEREIAALRPQLIVCLGATAASALLGKSFRVSLQRGQMFSSPHAEHIYATLHPSALLRVPKGVAREVAYQQFVADLRLIHQVLKPA
jgi:uracil-DNA glycosylase family protein